MRTITPVGIAGAVLTTILWAGPAYARDHSSMTGDWTLVPAKSDFAGQPVVQTGSVTIHEQQGVIVVTRNFVYEGVDETYFYSDSTGSENNSTIHSGKDLKSKTRWDHDVLKVTTTRSGSVTLESYRLTSDGTLLVDVERPDHRPITLVFRRQ
jgi:hypothetical protein